MTPDDLDRLEALAAAARETSHDGWLNVPFLMAFIDDDDAPVMDPVDAQLVAALSPATVQQLIAAARLGAAWQAAEAALPEGWRIRSLIELPGPLVEWEIVAAGEQRIVRASGPTPAAALLSLAEALRGRP